MPITTATRERERLHVFTEQQYVEHRSLDFVRWIKCVNAAGEYDAARQFKATYPGSHSLELVEKAAVVPGTTSDGTWAGPLVGAKELRDGFVAFTHPQTILGRLNTRPIPFSTPVAVQTGGASYAWVQEGFFAKPISAMAFSSLPTLGPATATGIIAVTNELLRGMGAANEQELRTELSNGLIEFLDKALLDDTVAAGVGHPGGILNGVAPIVSTGPSLVNFRTDLTALVRAFTTAHPSLASAVLLMSPANALLAAIDADTRLRLTADSGPRLLTSASVGNRLVLLDESQLLVADDGGVQLASSKDASLQMNSAPDSPPSVTTVMVSLWQMNYTAFRVERLINWRMATPAAVAWVSGATYTGV